MNESLGNAVNEASVRSEVRDEVRRIYSDLQAQIDTRQPACVASGRCCRFEQFGHRLFVTTAELATFLYDLIQTGKNLEAEVSAWDGAGCPFQTGKLCGVHAIRPFGCRIFFCDPTAEAWQREQYEAFHGELRSLHERLKVPYFYVEWQSALGMIRA